MMPIRKSTGLLRFIFATRACLLIAGTVMAQGQAAKQGSPAENDPVKSGYAIITPTPAATAGLVVFETFGEQRGNDLMQAGVLTSEMSVHTLLFVSTDGRLSKNIGVAIANPGAAEVSLKMILRDDTGKELAG